MLNVQIRACLTFKTYKCPGSPGHVNQSLLKSPGLPPMDYCAFGLLKQALFKQHFKTLDGHGKIVKEKWNKIMMF